jgi:hypothetical protein
VFTFPIILFGLSANSFWKAEVYEKVIQSYAPAFNGSDRLKLKIWILPFLRETLLIMGRSLSRGSSRKEHPHRKKER